MREIPLRSQIGAVLFAATLFAVPLRGQQPTPPAESVPAAPSSSVPIPPPPTAGQLHYLKGLQTVGRGVAQLKDGVSRVARAERLRDTLRVRQAGSRLSGLCGAARGFLVSGRGAMESSAYEPPVRRPARDLVLQVDSLSLIVKECQLTAGKAPGPVSAALLARLAAYEAAVAQFRTAIGLPNR